MQHCFSIHWKQKLKENPKNENAWYNYYLSLRYIQLENKQQKIGAPCETNSKNANSLCIEDF